MAWASGHRYADSVDTSQPQLPSTATTSADVVPHHDSSAAPAHVGTRNRRRLRRRVVLCFVDLIGVATALVMLTAPGVLDAPARVAAVDTAHHSHPVDVTVSDRIAMATVAAEDERFYSHHGIDTPGLLRAAWGVVTRVDLGGSTIDQQLAKVLYTNGDAGFLSRVSQTAIALKLEAHYTKTAILSMYLDAVYYGHGYYGIAAASTGYFGVSVAQLTWPQAALLAGLPQAPSLLDPYRDLSLARQRQQYVLGRLVATGALTSAQAQAAALAPLALRPQ